ncbi:MAG TPA: hypothetical protein VIH53_00840 [Gemmatimonadaceae bacterium]
MTTRQARHNYFDAHARRMALVVVGSVLATSALPLVLPIPKMEEAITLCYPVIGPVQRFNRDLSGSALARTRAHEAAHATQCRTDGAIWHFVRGALPRQRLALEAEAYCAEANFEIAKGGHARLEYPRIQDEMREMTRFRRVPSELLTNSIAEQCPVVATVAAQEEADWRARIRSPERR